MKSFLIVLISIFAFKCYAQTSEITIVLKDSETELPISDAIVFVLKSKQNLISNAEGTVAFAIKGISNIQISHPSYKNLSIRTTALKDKINVLYLKNSVTSLDEIIVTKQHPQKILANIVKSSIKKLTMPARLKVYSREFFKFNGEYSFYNDGLMNFQISGKSGDFKNDILVEQNRSKGLINIDLNNYLLGYNLNDIMKNYYSFKYLNPILDTSAKKKYDYIIKSYTANENYNVMHITPVDESNKLLDDYTIVYDRKNKIIIEANASVSPTVLSKVTYETAVGSKNVYKSLFKTMYKFDGINYYLLCSKEEIGYEKVEKGKTNNVEVRNYLVTTHFSNQNFSFKAKEVFKDKSLFNKKDVVLNDFWNLSGLLATDEELAIINSIQE